MGTARALATAALGTARLGRRSLLGALDRSRVPRGRAEQAASPSGIARPVRAQAHGRASRCDRPIGFDDNTWPLPMGDRRIDDVDLDMLGHPSARRFDSGAALRVLAHGQAIEIAARGDALSGDRATFQRGRPGARRRRCGTAPIWRFDCSRPGLPGAVGRKLDTEIIGWRIER